MIVFDLKCDPAGHRFEGWFASAMAFESQLERGLVSCPHCGSLAVAKAPMAPAVGRKGNRGTASAAQPAAPPMTNAAVPAGLHAVMQKLATMQAEALKASTWVGDKFAEKSRAMHYGESETETIHGQATIEEAKALAEEGVAVMPLPFPVAPPDELN